MDPLDFEKWQGLGNDFVLLAGGDPGPELAIRLCDRRRGVGADGVLAILEEAGGVRMIVRNADGSRPETCGNGVRCVVGHVALRRGLVAGEVLILTDAGARTCAFERDGIEHVHVTVAMGRARLEGPVLAPSFDGHTFVRVDLGNPHAVSFDPFVEADLDWLGPALEKGTVGGINVELCRVVAANRIEVIVWERGCGRTQACGSGACAVAAAAVAAGLAAANEPIEVVLPGGALVLEVDQATGMVTMRGPAALVYRGTTSRDRFKP